MSSATSTIVVTGRMSPNTSPCARAKPSKRAVSDDVHPRPDDVGQRRRRRARAPTRRSSSVCGRLQRTGRRGPAIDAVGRRSPCSPATTHEVARADRRASSRPAPRTGRREPWRSTRAHQWRKWRRPVKTIATPASSAAAMTSSSRIEPPGWTTPVTPRLDRQLGAVGEREERVGGQHRALQRVEPAPSRPPGGPSRRGSSGRRRSRPSRRPRASTIALDCTWRADAPGEQQVAPTPARSARALVTTSISSRSSRAASRSWTSRPPVDLADVRLAERRAAALLVLEDADVRLAAASISSASSS